jgi:tRNA threonylcarbamoyladenosine biosynthesis protein TsaB
MYILGIETATDVCGVALAHNGNIIDEISRDEQHIHAKFLVPMVQQMLLQQNMQLAELDGIAISIGPGSFTGLRIGLSVSKGLAYAGDVPLIAVSTLESIAAKYFRKYPATDASVVAILEIQRDEFAIAKFWRGSDYALEHSATMLWKKKSSDIPEEFFAENKMPIVLCGAGADKLHTAFPLAQLQHIVCAEKYSIICSAGSVALLGEEQLFHNDIADIATLEPNYMKEFALKASNLFERIHGQ